MECACWERTDTGGRDFSARLRIHGIRLENNKSTDPSAFRTKRVRREHVSGLAKRVWRSGDPQRERGTGFPRGMSTSRPRTTTRTGLGRDRRDTGPGTRRCHTRRLRGHRVRAKRTMGLRHRVRSGFRSGHMQTFRVRGGCTIRRGRRRSGTEGVLSDFGVNLWRRVEGSRASNPNDLLRDTIYNSVDNVPSGVQLRL